MLKSFAAGGSLLVLAALATAGMLDAGNRIARADEPAPMKNMQSEAPDINRAVCVMFKTGADDKAEVCGTIHFEKAADGKIHVTGEIKGLSSGKHGFHVHEYGDLTSLKDGKSAGSHFAPHDHKHGRPDSDQRHVGDLGNITVGDNGVAKIDITDSVISFDGANSILGRGLVVHKGEDKFTQPTGDADGRYAVGVIGIAHP